MADRSVVDSDRTPSMEELIRVAIESYLVEINTCMPAKIESYDPEKQEATVQPLFKRVLTSGSEIVLPLIANVPVQFPRSKEGFLHFPLEKDDPCILVFSQRNIDPWRVSGEVVDPKDNRTFDLSDAIAIPGVSPDNNKLAIDDPDDVVLAHGKSSIAVQKSGKFKIQNEDNELFSLLSDWLTSLAAARTATIGGPQPLIDTADPSFVLLKAKIDAMKGD